MAGHLRRRGRSASTMGVVRRVKIQSISCLGGTAGTPQQAAPASQTGPRRRHRAPVIYEPYISRARHRLGTHGPHSCLLAGVPRRLSAFDDQSTSISESTRAWLPGAQGRCSCADPPRVPSWSQGITAPRCHSAHWRRGNSRVDG